MEILKVLARVAGVLAGSVLAVFAQSSPTHLDYTNDGFSITLPPGWKEVSPEQVGKLRAMDPSNLRLPLQGIVHVYQIESAAKPLDPPFVLVHVAKSGRLSDFVMRRFLQTNDRRGEIRQLLRAQSMDANVRSASFDTNQFVVK